MGTPITLVGVHILWEAPWKDYIGSHYVLGAVGDVDVAETVGFLNSSFPHSTTKKLLQLKNEFSKAAGYKKRKIKAQKSFVNLHTDNEPSEKELKNNNPLTIASKIYSCIQE